MKLNLRLLSLFALGASTLSYVRAEDPAPATAENLQAAHNTADGNREAMITAGEAPAPRRDPAKMRAHRLKKLDEKLQLTADQKAQVQAIWSKAEEQGRALRDDKTIAHEDRRAKMGDLLKSTHDQVRTILTPEQQKTFDAMPVEPMGRRGHRPAGDKPADAPMPAPQS